MVPTFDFCRSFFEEREGVGGENQHRQSAEHQPKDGHGWPFALGLVQEVHRTVGGITGGLLQTVVSDALRPAARSPPLT